MKTFLSFFFVFSTVLAIAQVPQPTMLWLRGIGGDGSSKVLAPVIKTDDGGFIIHLQTNSSIGSGNIDSFCANSGNRELFIKYNSDASLLELTKCYLENNDTAFSYLFPTSDGGTVFGGMYISFGSGIYICKHDAAGNILWSHSYSKGNTLSLTNMIATTDGGYIISATSNFTDTNVSTHYGSWTDPDFFVMKVDSSGNKLWAKVIGGTGSEGGTSLMAAPGGGCYLVGSTTSGDNDCVGNHGGSEDAYVARLDKNGGILWHRDLGGNGDDAAYGSVSDGKGGIIIAAHTNSMDGDVSHPIGGFQNYWVVSLDSAGNILWNNSYGGGGGKCYPNSICKAADGSIWIAGVSQTKYAEIDTFYGRDDAWIVHIDSVGNFLGAKVAGSNMDDRGTMIYPLSNNNIIAGGFYCDNNGTFNSLPFYGSPFNSLCAFLTIFSANTVGIGQFAFSNSEVSIFPNPVSEIVSIDIAPQGKYTLIISDILGKIVYERTVKNKTQVQANGWQRGMYFVRVIGDDGYNSIQKLMVQ